MPERQKLWHSYRDARLVEPFSGVLAVALGLLPTRALLNDVNPSGFRARVNVPSTGLADPALLQPTTYSGDFRRPDQRVGQVGFRLSF